MIRKATVLDNEASQKTTTARTVEEFEDFVADAEPRLRRALVALYGSERGRDATAEALGYAWEHWGRVKEMDNATGYLFRVAQSKTRRRREPIVLGPTDVTERAFEPHLAGALSALSGQQRLAVVLVYGFDWRSTEVAALVGVKATTVQNHLERGLRRLRKSLGVDDHGE